MGGKKPTEPGERPFQVRSSGTRHMASCCPDTIAGQAKVPDEGG